MTDSARLGVTLAETLGQIPASIGEGEPVAPERPLSLESRTLGLLTLNASNSGKSDVMNPPKIIWSLGPNLPDENTKGKRNEF